MTTPVWNARIYYCNQVHILLSLFFAFSLEGCGKVANTRCLQVLATYYYGNRNWLHPAVSSKIKISSQLTFSSSMWCYNRAYCWVLVLNKDIYIYIVSHTFTFQLLDKPCRPFFPPVLAFKFYRAHRVQQSNCTSISHLVLLTHAVALSASQFMHKKKSQRICTGYALGGARTHETDRYQARG